MWGLYIIKINFFLKKLLDWREEKRGKVSSFWKQRTRQGEAQPSRLSANDIRLTGILLVGFPPPNLRMTLNYPIVNMSYAAAQRSRDYLD